MVWSWAGPPDIAHQVGNTVYLHSGDHPGRYGPSVYDKVTTSDYTIRSIGHRAVMVSSLGQNEIFHGVDHIVARGGALKDSIFVMPGVNARLDFDGLGGNDNFVILGGGAGSVVRGGVGNDTFRSGPAGGIQFLGGEGDDVFVGGTGGAIIDMGDGNNTISLAGGHSEVRIANSPDTRVRINGGTANIDTDLNGFLDVRGRGSATVKLDPVDSSETLVLRSRDLTYGARTVAFDAGVSRFIVNDTSAATPLRVLMAPDQHWDSTSLTLTTPGLLDLSEARLSGNDFRIIFASKRSILIGFSESNIFPNNASYDSTC
jgi:Ca2+-binding RTX toxin-like protein